MSASRDEMIAELKRVVVPVLRELGFRGSFPPFRRTGDTRVDLLLFQFSAMSFVLATVRPATDRWA